MQSLCVEVVFEEELAETLHPYGIQDGRDGQDAEVTGFLYTQLTAVAVWGQYNTERHASPKIVTRNPCVQRRRDCATVLTYISS